MSRGASSVVRRGTSGAGRSGRAVAPGGRARQADVLAPLLIVAAVVAAYHNSLDGPFVFDDVLRIPHNLSIRQLWPPWGTFAHTTRPLAQWTLAVNYALGGLGVRSFHVLNLAVHALVALALYGLARRTLARREPAGRARGLALVIALLWGTHPLTTQAVTYISGRSESLMALFFLLALDALARGAGSARPARWTALATLCGALSAASKTVMISLPVVALLYDRAFFAGSFRAALGKRGWMYAGLTAGTLLALALLRAAPEEYARSAGFAARGVTPLQYLATQPGVILHYLRLALWPHPLVLDYGWPLARGAGEVAAPAAALMALLAATLWALKRRPALGFLAAAFFLILALTSSIVPVADAAFEHRMYLPLAAVVTLAVLGGDALLRTLAARARWGPRPARVAGAFVVAVLAVVLAAATVRRNQDYRSALALWSDTVAKRPSNARARNNLGKELEEMGRSEEALAQYREALRLKPDLGLAYNNVGHVLDRRGRMDEAVAYYQDAIRLDPELAWAHVNLGAAHARQGQPERGLAEFREALRLDPEFPEARENLGLALAGQGRLEEAIAEYRRGLVVKPDYAEAHLNLGVALARLGRPDEALAHFREAVRLKPGWAEAHYDLGYALALRGERAEAERELEAALALDPGLEPARRTLAGLRGQAIP